MSRQRVVGLPELFLGLLAIAVAAVWVGKIFASTIHDAKHANDTIVVTGSARKPIAADLVQWQLSVSGAADTPIAAAANEQESAATLNRYLQNAGIAGADISARVVRSRTVVTRISKKQIRTTYVVAQGFLVSSRAIDTVEAASRRLAALLEQGVDVDAQPLAYISTDLDQAKLDALSAATADARRRADILVSGLGGHLGRLRATSLGVYQITPRNSTEVSDYGFSDTTSRLKDVTAVVSATFAVEK